jgi:DNA-binding CsgD family transcriptional regulator
MEDRGDPWPDKFLSRREELILSLLGPLESDDSIAGFLGVAASTVRKHRSNIARKLGCSSHQAMLRAALKHGYARAMPDGRLGTGIVGRLLFPGAPLDAAEVKPAKYTD